MPLSLFGIRCISSFENKRLTFLGKLSRSAYLVSAVLTVQGDAAQPLWNKMHKQLKRVKHSAATIQEITSM
jgi:hypothetical protein